MRVSGFIGQAGVSRASRAQQFVFVNGRAVESPVISAALKEGYHTALMKGQFPVTFLFVELDPAEVDVNVHPAKREVRFRDPTGVREAVIGAIRRTLESDRSSWQEQFRAPAASDVPFVRPPEALAPANGDAQPGFAIETSPPRSSMIGWRLCLTRSVARWRSINSESSAS